MLPSSPTIRIFLAATLPRGTTRIYRHDVSEYNCCKSYAVDPYSLVARSPIAASAHSFCKSATRFRCAPFGKKFLSRDHLEVHQDV
jgi:hypothetical protein